MCQISVNIKAFLLRKALHFQKAVLSCSGEGDHTCSHVSWVFQRASVMFRLGLFSRVKSKMKLAVRLMSEK